MENSKDSPSSSSSTVQTSASLTNELKQGKEFARQLQVLLSESHSSNSHELRGFLVQQIIASFNRAVSIAQQADTLKAPSPPSQLAIPRSDSSQSGGGSPRSEDSNSFGEDSRRRKALPKWTRRVEVSQETGFEGPPGDGYNWRKYGQKDILKATYPRSYYRCALKQQASCIATKQVQRCDEDPTFFDVIYKGLHTCIHRSTPNPTLPSSSSSCPQPQFPETLICPPKETLINFRTPNTSYQHQNIDFSHHHHHHSSSPSNPFGIHSPSPSAATNVATTTVMSSPTTTTADLPIVDHDFPFDQFDLDDSRFFH